MTTPHPAPLAPSSCDQCGHTELVQERGSLGSFWKRRSLELTLFICLRCGRALTYVDPGGSWRTPSDDGAQL